MGWFVLGRPDKKDYAGNTNDPGNKRKIAIIVAALFLLAALSFGGLAWASKTVELTCDNETIQVKTFKRTVEEVLAAQEIVLGDRDQVTPTLDSPVTDKMNITVQRAFNVDVIAGGEEDRYLTCARTVGEMLEENNIELATDDLVEPLIGEILEKDMVINIIRVTKETIEEDVSVQYKTKYQENSSMLKGQNKVINPGSKGTERCYWEITYHNGEEQSKELLRKEQIKAPVDRVVQIGTQQTVSRGGESLRFSDSRSMVATAYTHTGYRTASGVMPSRGTVAVDTRFIPFGTRLYIEGYGYGTAQDRGGAIKGDRIDLFFETRQEALNWGRRTVSVYLLD